MIMWILCEFWLRIIYFENLKDFCLLVVILVMVKFLWYINVVLFFMCLDLGWLYSLYLGGVVLVLCV